MKILSVLLTLKSLNRCAGLPLSNLMMNQRYQTSSNIAASQVGESADDLVMSWRPPKKSGTLSKGCSILAYQYKLQINGSDSTTWHSIPQYATCFQRFRVENGLITRGYSSGVCPKRPEGAKLIPNTPVSKSTR